RRSLLVDKSNYGTRDQMLVFRLEFPPTEVFSRTLNRHVMQRYGRVTDWTVTDAAMQRGGGPSAVEKAEEWLQDHLEAHGELAVADIETLLDGRDFGRETLRKARDRMAVETIKRGQAGYWVLAEQ